MNVADLVAAAATRHPEGPALRDLDGRSHTWSQVEDRVAALAGVLRREGIGPGDHVAVLHPNGLVFPIVFWAVLRAGAAVVPLNPAYTPRELGHLLADSGARTAFVHPMLEGGMRTAGPDVRILALDADGVPGDAALDAPPMTEPAGGGSDTAVLCYTSGTTGAPKGAVLSHDNFLANLEDFGRLPLLTLDADDVLLGLLPFFHIFGLNVILNAAARDGACVLAMDRFNPVGSLQALAEHGVTVAYGAPPVFAAWNAVAAQTPLRAPSLRAAVSGADALPVATWDAFAERFGVEICEGYGLTECAPVLTSNAAASAVRPGTVGLALPRVHLRIADPAGRELPTGQIGEICAAGPNVFSGYHRAPEASAEALRDGWFHTGDLGWVDPGGHLTISGRLKDMIIVSGFNVYPREIEEVLLAHPAIADAAVIGVPDDRTGERVRALVVRGGDVTAEALAAWCRERLARYKLPRDLEFVPAIPRRPTGKVERTALRDLGTRAPTGG